MENTRFTLPLLPTPGKLTTIYAVDGGAVRNAVLTTMATLLAERAGAGTPVLMIDWDTESPGLHEAFGDAGSRDGHARPGHSRRGHSWPGHSRPGHPWPGHSRPGHSRRGLLEYFAACRVQLELLRGHEAADWASPEAGDPELLRARQVFAAVDWEPYVERVDASRPLYLMRAGAFDDSYGERAAAADWEGLFAAGPSLFRCFAEHLARRFSHVLVASRGGRSAAVSVCTSLLPDRLVMLFSPTRRSLDGACGVVRRAIEYRSSHEDAQRPLLVYPMPVDLDGADQGRRLRWRHGDPGCEAGGYQAVLESLLRECYALPALSLDSYLDNVQLQQINAMSEALAPRLPLTADRFSLARAIADLLDWAAEGAFAWQARSELALDRRIAWARAADSGRSSPAVSTRLAADLLELGRLQKIHGRIREALASFSEAAALQSELWGVDHADTRDSRASVAAALRLCGKGEAAMSMYRSLYEECVRELGPAHADTLAARAGLAAALADCGQFDPALVHAEQVVSHWRERHGLNHRSTLDAQAFHAGVLAQAGELGRARMLLEQVLEGRERVLGAEHADSLAGMAQLADVLGRMGHQGSARSLQEQVLASRQHLLGIDHADTIAAAMALAETVAAQCDLPTVGQLCGPLEAACNRRYASGHAPAQSTELQLANALAQRSGLMSAPHAPARPAAPLLPTDSDLDAAAVPHESGFVSSASFGPCSHDDADGIGQVDAIEIERGVIRLEQMDDLAAEEARELADRLREPVMMADLAPPVRARGVRAIVDVYFHQGDTDALIAFMQEQRPMPIR